MSCILDSIGNSSYRSLDGQSSGKNRPVLAAGERLLSTRNLPLKRRFYGILGVWK